MESQRTLSTLMDNLPGIAYRCQNDQYWTMEFLSNGCFDLTGYNADELVNNRRISYADLIHSEDRDMVWEAVQDALKRKRTFQIVYRIKTKSGALKWVWEQGCGLFPNGAKTAAIEGFITDITDQKQTEEALRNSEEQYRRLVELSPIGIAIHHKGNIIYVNKAAAELMGAQNRRQLIGRSALDFVHDNYKEIARQRIQEVLTDNKPSPIVEEKFIRLDGAVIDVEVISIPFNLNGEQAIQVIARDVSEQKRLQEQLIRAQKMEAIGKLAGGIAHDFNNLLTVINGYSSLLLTKLKDSSDLLKEIEMINKAGQRAASLTSQLLAFSRQQIVQPKTIDLNEVISHTEKMLHRLIGEDIDLVTYLDPDLGNVKADEGQIEQIILNLAINARDAMPNGGKLTVETRNVVLDREYTEQHESIKPGAYIMLGVSDTGFGMDADTKKQIFEPFFTTKGKSEGTGLGLSTVYGIVQQSQGHIWVYSEIEKGTTFKIYLPRVDAGDASNESIQRKAKSHKGSETIVLVEDDDDVREFSRTALAEYGYEVLVAENGLHALDLCEKHKRKISILITDVIMPQISGKELVDKISAIHPELKVLFISGYTDSAIAHHGILDPDVAYLPKPFGPEALALKVREVLDTARFKGKF